MLKMIGLFLVLGGLFIIFRFWDPPSDANDEKYFVTKKELRIHSLIIGYGSLIIGIIILLYIILF